MRKWIGIAGIAKVFLKYVIIKPFLYLFTGFFNTIVLFFSLISFKSKKILILIVSLVIIAFAFVSFVAVSTWNAFDAEKLTNYSPPLSSIITDKNGEIITDIAQERRIFVPLDKVSKHLINAIISAEDRTFYKNIGVDISGTLRAGIFDVYYFLKGKKLHGASTVTQQVVRNVLLTNERTIVRKIKEIVLAYKLTKTLTKDKIMEVYLNHIYLGSKSYGVEMASREYFEKSAKDLTIEEAALVASLAKGPSVLNPKNRNPATLVRRNWIITSMFEEGYISQQEMENAIKTDIVLKYSHKKNRKPYSYIDYIIKYVEKKYNISKDDLEKNGYIIQTTFDFAVYNEVYKNFKIGLQKYDKRHGYTGRIGVCESDEYLSCLHNTPEPKLIAEEQNVAVVTNVDKDFVDILTDKNENGIIYKDDFIWARKRIDSFSLGSEVKSAKDVFEKGDIIIVSHVKDKKYQLDQIPDINGGVVVLNPKTNAVIAMLGGYLDVPGAFNRVTQAKRQPGSVAKIFSYIAGLENGFKLNDLLIDQSVSISAGEGVSWNLRNHTRDNYGTVTMRKAFEKSLNVPTINMVSEIGISKVIDVISRFNVSSNAQHNLSTCLGTFDATLLSMASAVSTIANGGVEFAESPVISLKYRTNGDSVEAIKQDTIGSKDEDVQEIIDELSNSKLAKDLPNSIISPQTAYQMYSLMNGWAKRTSVKLANISPHFFGKTGTTDGAKDLWFIGGSDSYVVGVYVGNDVPKSLGNEYGATVASPIGINIIEYMSEHYPYSEILPPDSGLKFSLIDRNNGQLLDNCGNLEARNCVKEVFLESDNLVKNNAFKTDNGTHDTESDTLTGVY